MTREGRRSGGLGWVSGLLLGWGLALLAYAGLVDRPVPAVRLPLSGSGTNFALGSFRFGLPLTCAGVVGSYLLVRGRPDGSAEARPARWRFGVETLMVVVAASALWLGVDITVRRRSERFASLARGHDGAFRTLVKPMAAGSNLSPSLSRRLTWHGRLSTKYRRAAERPWEPVDADPPPP